MQSTAYNSENTLSCSAKGTCFTYAATSFLQMQCQFTASIESNLLDAGCPQRTRFHGTAPSPKRKFLVTLINWLA